MLFVFASDTHFKNLAFPNAAKELFAICSSSPSVQVTSSLQVTTIWCSGLNCHSVAFAFNSVAIENQSISNSHLEKLLDAAKHVFIRGKSG